MAKWLSRDPIGEEGGINLYGYVGNNPINKIDPLGLAELYTDQTNGVTYFNPTPEEDGLVTSFASRSDVTDNSLPGAAGPYSSANVYPAAGPHRNLPVPYGPNDLLLTDDTERGRWLHGGGTGLPDPLAPYQGWMPTHGCTRLQNKDIQELVRLVRKFKKDHPGVKIPYKRSPDPYIPKAVPVPLGPPYPGK